MADYAGALSVLKQMLRGSAEAAHTGPFVVPWTDPDRVAYNLRRYQRSNGMLVHSSMDPYRRPLAAGPRFDNSGLGWSNADDIHGAFANGDGALVMLKPREFLSLAASATPGDPAASYGVLQRGTATNPSSFPTQLRAAYNGSVEPTRKNPRGEYSWSSPFLITRNVAPIGPRGQRFYASGNAPGLQALSHEGRHRMMALHVLDPDIQIPTLLADPDYSLRRHNVDMPEFQRQLRLPWLPENPYHPSWGDPQYAAKIGAKVPQPYRLLDPQERRGGVLDDQWFEYHRGGKV